MAIAADRDLDVQTLVSDELAWTPEVDAAGIGVAVEDGTVTLSGEVDTYAERLAAKHAALRVRGVRAVVDNLSVHPKTAMSVTETDIAREVERALRASTNVSDTVKAEIDEHHVTLIGEVDWDYQRRAAARAVHYLRGVHTVSNMITLASRPTAADTEERIKNAFVRNARLDASHIHASVTGSKVTLTGTATSWAERRHAAHVAWASPHVTDVDNQITVRPL